MSKSFSSSAIPELRQWFRVDEAAEIFGVSRKTIRNWLDDGSLDARRISNSVRPERCHVRVTRDSIMRLLNDDKRRVS